jgi:hypothetical protein
MSTLAEQQLLTLAANFQDPRKAEACRIGARAIGMIRQSLETCLVIDRHQLKMLVDSAEQGDK